MVVLWFCILYFLPMKLRGAFKACAHLCLPCFFGVDMLWAGTVLQLVLEITLLLRDPHSSCLVSNSTLCMTEHSSGVVCIAVHAVVYDAIGTLFSLDLISSTNIPFFPSSDFFPLSFVCFLILVLHTEPKDMIYPTELSKRISHRTVFLHYFTVFSCLEYYPIM